MFVTLKKTNFIEYFVLKPFSERRQREQGKPLEILQGGEEEAKELCRGCGLKKKQLIMMIQIKKIGQKTREKEK